MKVFIIGGQGDGKTTFIQSLCTVLKKRYGISCEERNLSGGKEYCASFHIAGEYFLLEEVSYKNYNDILGCGRGDGACVVAICSLGGMTNDIVSQLEFCRLLGIKTACVYNSYGDAIEEEELAEIFYDEIQDTEEILPDERTVALYGNAGEIPVLRGELLEAAKDVWGKEGDMLIRVLNYIRTAKPEEGTSYVGGWTEASSYKTDDLMKSIASISNVACGYSCEIEMLVKIRESTFDSYYMVIDPKCIATLELPDDSMMEKFYIKATGDGCRKAVENLREVVSDKIKQAQYHRYMYG